MPDESNCFWPLYIIMSTEYRIHMLPNLWTPFTQEWLSFPCRAHPVLSGLCGNICWVQGVGLGISLFPHPKTMFSNSSVNQNSWYRRRSGVLGLGLSLMSWTVEKPLPLPWVNTWEFVSPSHSAGTLVLSVPFLASWGASRLLFCSPGLTWGRQKGPLHPWWEQEWVCPPTPMKHCIPVLPFMRPSVLLVSEPPREGDPGTLPGTYCCERFWGVDKQLPPTPSQQPTLKVGNTFLRTRINPSG